MILSRLLKLFKGDKVDYFTWDVDIEWPTPKRLDDVQPAMPSFWDGIQEEAIMGCFPVKWDYVTHAFEEKDGYHFWFKDGAMVTARPKSDSFTFDEGCALAIVEYICRKYCIDFSEFCDKIEGKASYGS